MNTWQENVKYLLKSELLKNNLTRSDLAELLQKNGITETKASIDNKLSRGTFSAAFFLQCLYVMNGQLKYGSDTLAVPTINSPVSVYLENLHRRSIRRENFFHKKQGVRYKDITQADEIVLSDKKVISLFTGAGGFDIGIEAAGFETAVCVEIDPDCRETLRANRPQWKLFEDNTGRVPGDIRSISPKELLETANAKKGEIALVIGGAPCQPFSNIGKRKGKTDPNIGDLFLEFVRMIKGILPKAFIFENVAGIIQSRHSDVIEYMKDKLKGLGYGISYTILNAANYGVAQRRERFFLLGIQNIDVPAFPLPTYFKGFKEWREFCHNLDQIPDYVPENWKTLQEVFKKIPTDAVNRNDYAVMNISEPVIERMKLIQPGENFKVLPMDMRPDCWKNGKHQGQDTFGRLRLDEPSITIRTAAYNPAKGKYIHPTENRGLTTLEMAAIQGFPYEWIFRCVDREKVTLVSAGKQIGNAVPPLLAKALGNAVRIQLNEVSTHRPVQPD